jgi:metallo-beta-lactamase class B
MKKSILILFLITGLVSNSSKQSSSKEKQISQNASTENVEIKSMNRLPVYETEYLIIKKLSNHIFQHISFLNSDDFRKVECNGMLIISGNEGVVFHSPTDNESSTELMNFVANVLQTTITAIVPTHFHDDCVGGILEFEKECISIYLQRLTANILKENGKDLTNSMITFDSSLTLDIGSKKTSNVLKSIFSTVKQLS